MRFADAAHVFYPSERSQRLQGIVRADLHTEPIYFLLGDAL